MTYVLPKETIVDGPGDFFFETGDINHTVYNKTDAVWFVGCGLFGRGLPGSGAPGEFDLRSWLEVLVLRP